MTDSGLECLLIIFLIYSFLMCFLCLFKRRIHNFRSRQIARQNVGVRVPRRKSRGLDPAVIDTFPTFQYSVVKELKFGKGALECAVCLNEFQDEETIRLLPKCDHVFHSNCIDAWLSNRTTCPVCRANLVPESAETNETMVVSIQDLEGESESESESDIGELETVDGENQQVSIHLIGEEEPPREVAVAVAVGVAVAVAVSPEVVIPVQTQMQKGPSVKLPRSHSTGHSLVQPGEDIERFTLRLPDDVRRQIMQKKLKRTSSTGLLPRVETGEGSSRGGREGWVFSMVPNFLTRWASPARSPKMTAGGDATVTTPPAKPFWSPLRG